MSKFVATNNKGFQMTFENGFRISVQWGVGNYCQKKDDGEYGDSMKTDFWESNSAEMAVFGKDGEFINIRGYELEKEDGTVKKVNDVVAGWLSADTVAKCITIVQLATTEEEIETKLKALNLLILIIYQFPKGLNPQY